MGVNIQVTESTKIRVSKFKHKGKTEEYVRIQQWYKKKGSEDWLPGRAGISISVDLMGRIVKAAKKVIEGAAEIVSKED